MEGGGLRRATRRREKEGEGGGAGAEWLRAAWSEATVRAHSRGGLANMGGQRGAGDAARYG
jgi:hypothetical protein